MSSVYSCASCGARFSFDRAALDRHPDLKPVLCPGCYSAAAKPEPEVSAPEDRAEIPPQLQRVLDGVLQRYTTGPSEGIFTDGACSGNPGPGGWGAVFVRENRIVAQRFGYDPDTTNNRMELTALIAAYEMLDEAGAGQVVIWSDSQLCVNTFTQWAPKWEAKGWRRKGGPIANLDLVKPLYELVKRHPEARLRWIKAHAGTRWNEYVDALAYGQIELE
jgi:ribonuclease HI